ncbi:MAG: hypothetical protein ACRDBG_09775 [Waterburya sp.]
MPSNMYRKGATWDKNFVNVLATEGGIRSPRGVTMDLASIPSTLEGSKILIPGHIISTYPPTFADAAVRGYGRVFPASRATAAAAGTTIPVRDASCFRIGEAVVRVARATNGFTPADFATTTAVGNVTAINFDTNVVTVSAAPATPFAVGDILYGQYGANALTDIIGIVVKAIEISKDNPNDQGIYTSATLYGARMPFWDAAIQNRFPELTLVPRQNSFVLW